MIERGGIVDKSEEVYVFTKGACILGFCGFQRRFKDGSREGKRNIGLADT
jgi:hypothetical protein